MGLKPRNILEYMDDMHGGGDAQEPYDSYVDELRTYVNMVKREILYSLERSDPEDPNKTHDLSRYENARETIIHFGNALQEFFINTNTLPDQLVSFHTSVFKDESVNPNKFVVLREHIPVNIAIQYIKNDTQMNTTSFKK